MEKIYKNTTTLSQDQNKFYERALQQDNTQDQTKADLACIFILRSQTET
jgi:hypothetical protein